MQQNLKSQPVLKVQEWTGMRVFIGKTGYMDCKMIIGKDFFDVSKILKNCPDTPAPKTFAACCVAMSASHVT